MSVLNRLWVRLSLFFSLFILCGVLMVTVLPRLLISYNFSGVLTQAQADLIDNLAQFYQKNGGWSGVTDLVQSYDFTLPRGFEARPTALVFADADGTILYDGTNQRRSAPLTEAERAEATPVLVAGQTRGYVLRQIIALTLPPVTTDLILSSVLNALLGLGIVIGGLGLIAGIVVSRQLTAPLSDLAETVRTFRKPNLGQRAVVKGTVEVREVATAFNDMADALTEAERLRRNLVGDVAHELRTPLTVLQANVQAILDDLYPLDKTEIQRLQDQTDLLRRLVNDLHELAQAEARRLPLHVISVNLNDLVCSLVEHFDAVVQLAELTLSAQVPPAPIQAAVDPDRIAQVLQNLIQNAITHTPAGGSITVGLAREGQSACLTVSDTGTGISSEDQRRVFERFYRADEARSRALGGAGLGLPIAKAIVEMHDGSISVHSDGIAGHGTVFIITLAGLNASVRGLCQSAAARFADHQVNRGLDEQRHFGFVLDAPDDPFGGQFAHQLLAYLHRRQRRHGESGFGNIVKAGHRDVFRHPQPVLMQPLNRADCQQVGGADQRVRRMGERHQLLRARAAQFARPAIDARRNPGAQVVVGRQTVRPYRRLETALSLVGVAGDEAESAASQLDQMIDHQPNPGVAVKGDGVVLRANRVDGGHQHPHIVFQVV